MKTRLLEPSDASAIAALWRAGALEGAATEPSFHPRVTVAEYAVSVSAELASGAILGWGAFAAESNLLLGYLTARAMEPRPEVEEGKFLDLLDLDVRSDSRRQGVGSRLVALARRFASEQGLGTIEVSWLSSDQVASAFWRSQGFTQFLARARSSPVA